MIGNLPTMVPGIIAVSRGCFPVSLAERRRNAIVKAFGEGLYECPIAVQTEQDAHLAMSDVKDHNVNALIVYLGNFGPETPETMLADWFDGPIMYVAAAEGDGDLYDGRGDAFCGMLNCSYNLNLRHRTAYIPEYPVGTASEVAEKIHEFLPIATAIVGLKGLKLIAFGPRPNDFLACNAPIKALYDIGVAVEENSELDLLAAYNKHKGDARIAAVAAEMAAELGASNPYAGVLPRLAQYEITLPIGWKSIKHQPLCCVCQQVLARSKQNSGLYPAMSTAVLPHAVSPSVAKLIFTALERVYWHLRFRQTGHAAGHQQHRARLDVQKNIEGNMTLRCRRLLWAPLRQHLHQPAAQPAYGYQLIMKRDLEPDLPEPDITRTIEGDIRRAK